MSLSTATRRWLSICGACAMCAAATAKTPASTDPPSALLHPTSSRDVAIDGANARQLTPDGSLAAFERELPRIHAPSVGVLWLMPVQPIESCTVRASSAATTGVRPPSARWLSHTSPGGFPT